MSRNVLFWLSAALVLMFVFNMAQGPNVLGGAAEKVSYSEFMDRAQGGQVVDVTIKGSSIEGNFAGGEGFYAMWLLRGRRPRA